jgi:two-component system, NarL family, nitrate/nitrite response regulator NarL
VQMPGDGIEAAREIHARLPRAVVVMFSAYEDTASREEALHAGASGCLPKTMQLQRLGDMLLDLLAR